MRAAFQISDAEMVALDGEPFAARVLYFEIRRRMDFATGLVGARKGAGISWQALREALYVEPGQGVTESGSPSKAALRRLCERLERAGLIANQSRDRRLILRCRMARINETPSSAPKKPGTNPAQTRHSEPDTQPGTDERAENPLSQHAQSPPQPDQPGTYPGTNPAQVETQKPGTPPVSDTQGRSSREQENIPRAHVDRWAEPFFLAFESLAEQHERLEVTRENCQGDARVRALAERWHATQISLEELSAAVDQRLSKSHNLARVTPAYFVPMLSEYLERRQPPKPDAKPRTSQGSARKGNSPTRETGTTPEDDRALRERDEAALVRKAQALGVDSTGLSMVELRFAVLRAEAKQSRGQVGTPEGLQHVRNVLAGGGHG